MLESALVLYRDELISVSKGRAASVDFNFEEIWDAKKKIGKNFSAAHLYWVHVHPPGFGTTPSTTDEICAMSLKAAFGSVDHFGIICFSDPTFKNIRGLISWYRYADPEQGLIKVEEHELESDRFLLEEEVYILKALSYGDAWKQKESEYMASEQSEVTS